MKYIVSGLLLILMSPIFLYMVEMKKLSNATSELKSERRTYTHEVQLQGYHQFLDDYFNSKDSQDYQFSREAFLASIGYPTQCEDIDVDYVYKYDLVYEGTSNLKFNIEIDLVCIEGVSLQVFGIVALPKNMEPKGLVLAIHGTAGTPQKIFGLEGSDSFAHTGYHHKFARQLVNDGFAVFAPSVLTQKNLIQKSYNITRNKIDKRASGLDLRLMGIETWSISNSIRIIKDIFEIKNARVGVYGISLGGALAFYISAVNEEISATVISNWSEDRVNKIFSREHQTANWRYEDNDYVIFQNGVFDTRDIDVIKNMIYPRPIFFEVGLNDDRSVGISPLIDNLLEITKYSENDSQRLCLHIGSGGHEIFYDKAEIFLSRWLMKERQVGQQLKNVCPPPRTKLN